MNNPLAAAAFDRLLIVMHELREKCPWDRVQTLDSIRHLTIEETYELSEAILSQDYNDIAKELGDLLLHIVFYSEIASETEKFTINDVIERLIEKLIRRHPHIYGDVQANDAEKVKENWEQIKLKEGAKSALAGVPKSLPALVKAYRIQEKAGSFGFQWEQTAEVVAKVEEEFRELKTEIEVQNAVDTQKLEAEFGDLLFSLVNLARYLKINPEDALERTNRKFISRFNYIEAKAVAQAKNLKDMSLAEMDQYWDEAKRKETETRQPLDAQPHNDETRTP